MRLMTTGILASLAATGFAAAQTVEGRDEIVLRDVFGTVTVDIGGGPLAVETSGPESGMLTVEEREGAVVVSGEAINERRFRADYKRARRGVRTLGGADRDPAFVTMLEDRPVIRVTAPEGTALRIEESAVRLTANGPAGNVTIDDTVHLLVRLDDIASGDIALHGNGYVGMKNVMGPLAASLRGSGDIVFESAESADLRVHGSGDIEGGDVAGALDAGVHGSGDIEVARVGGPAKARVHGSGDVGLGRAGAGLDAEVHGSGDLSVGEVAGDVAAKIHGSGDLAIEKGSAGRLAASINGSGDFEFGGTARSAELETRGSGGIRVREVSGDISARGRDIRVAGERVGADD